MAHLGTFWSPRLFAWQAWHLATSTFTLRGRREPWRHRPSLCVAGKALGDIELGWCLTTPSCTLRGRHGTYGTGLALVARLGSLFVAAVCVAGVALGDIDVHSVWQAWPLATSTCSLHGMCGTYGTGLALVALGSFGRCGCLRGIRVALDDMDLHFAWQAWHLTTSTCILRGRCGPWRHRPSLCAAGVALGDIENNTFTRNPFAHLTWICISCTHRSSTISCLFPALPIPSSPFFGYLLEEVDMWGYPVL